MVSSIAVSEVNLKSLKQPSIANLTSVQSYGGFVGFSRARLDYFASKYQ
jgi:hypothetical protein